MADLIDVLTEFEAKVDERWPDMLVREPPATVDQIKLAERIYEATLTDELVELYQLHNGCVGYPRRHMQIALPKTLEEFGGLLGRPGFAGPFDMRHAVTVLVADGVDVLHVPLTGDHRGQVYRDCLQETQYNARAALSVTALFQDWLYYLDNDYFESVPDAANLLEVAGSDFVKLDGRPVFEVLLEAWPDANPLTLTGSAYGFEEFLEQRQQESGMDPRIDPDHFDHGEILEFDVAELDRIGREIHDVDL